MADYKVTYKRYSGGSWNTIYFTTLADLVDDEGQENRFLHTEMVGNKRVLKTEDLEWLLNDSGLKDNFVPYDGATKHIDLGTKGIQASNVTAQNIYSHKGLYLDPSEVDGTTTISTVGGGVHFAFNFKKTTAFGTNGSSFAYDDTPDLETPLDIPHRGYIDTIKDNLESAIATGTKIVTAVKLTNRDSQTNITPIGTETLDGITPAVGDRVLLRNQSTSSNDGVWEVKSGAWEKIEVDSDEGSLVSVTGGTTLMGNQYYHSTVSGKKWVLYNTHYIYYGSHGIIIDGVNIKLADYGVTESKLVNGSVTENKIKNGAVTLGKLADMSSGIMGHLSTVEGPVEVLSASQVEQFLDLGTMAKQNAGDYLKKNNPEFTGKLSTGYFDVYDGQEQHGELIFSHNNNQKLMLYDGGNPGLYYIESNGQGAVAKNRLVSQDDVEGMIEDMNNIYWQNTAPTGKPEGSIWLDYEELT